MGELLSAVPQLVSGKCVIITSFDSGPFVPDETMRAGGWSIKSGLAYSPPVARPDDLPRNQYDEWYVYPSRTEIIPPEVFVNYAGFRLRYYAAEVELHGLLERFWLQMEKLRPESYLAEGEVLILATRDPALYEQALGWRSRRPETG